MNSLKDVAHIQTVSGGERFRPIFMYWKMSRV